MTSRVPPGVPSSTSSSVPGGPSEAEEILSSLGFVGRDPGGPSGVPPRFFSAPSRAHGIDLQLFLRCQARRVEAEDPCLLLARRFQQLRVLAATADAFFCLYSHPKTGGQRERGGPHRPQPPGTPLGQRGAEEPWEMEGALREGDDGDDDDDGGDNDGDDDEGDIAGDEGDIAGDEGDNAGDNGDDDEGGDEGDDDDGGDDAHQEAAQSLRVSITTQRSSTWLWSSVEGSLPPQAPTRTLRVSITTQTSSTWLWSSHGSGWTS